MRFSIFLFAILACTWVTTAQAAPDGARLYMQHCAACHGEDGNGGIGVPLALPSFQAVVSDDYLGKTILHGRPGRVMPAFATLSKDEIDAVVRHLRGWNKDVKPGAVYSTRPIKGNVAHGKSLYATYCAACHGANGEGGKGTGVTFSRPRELPIMPPALHNPGFLASATDEMIKITLIKGRQGTPMASFRELGLSDTDIDDLVSYVRSFENQSLAKSAEVLDAGAATLLVPSPYNLKTTIDNLKKAAVANNFVLIREQALNSGLVAEHREDRRQHVVYFCNFNLVNQALATDPRVGLFLPCRITVVEQNGKVRLLAANPKRLSRIFNNSELNELCEQMTQRYRTIMEEATL